MRGQIGYGTTVVPLSVAACFLALLAFPKAAYAASAGCTAANAGAFNQNVAAGGANAVGIAGALDQGDRLTITAAGNPNLATVQLLPSNTGIFGTAANLVQTVTVNEAGVTGLGITLLASVGQAATLTITCVPVGSASQGQTGAGSVAMTPDQTANTVDAATTAVTSNRLPTTPAALPGAGRRTIIRPQLFTRSMSDVRAALWNEYQAAVNDLFVRSHPQQNQFLGGGRDIEKTIADFERGIALFDAGQPLPERNQSTLREGWRYGRNLQSIKEEFAERMQTLGFPTADPDLLNPNTGIEAPPEMPVDEGVEADPAEIGDGDIVMLAPDANGRGFNFEMSTDALRTALAHRLDKDQASNAAMPPLTIAGMPVNIWARGRGTLFDRQSRAGTDGWAAHVLSGVALRVSDDLTVGAFGSYLAARSDTDLTSTQVDTRQGGGGAYLRLAVAQGISIGVSASREFGEQEIRTSSASGTADTNLWGLSGSVQGAYYVEPVLLSPSFAVSYAEFERDAYVDSTGTLIPGTSSGDTTLTAALTASRSYRFEDGWIRRLSPRLSGSLNYFARENDSFRVSATDVINTDTWGTNLGAGLTLLTDGASRISFDAGVIGIGQDTLGYTGQLQVEIGF